MSAAPGMNGANGCATDFGQARKDSQSEDEQYDDWLRGAPRLDEAALYGLGGRFVRLVEPCTEAHPAVLLLDFLAIFVAMVGNLSCLMPDGLLRFFVLFALVVGRTGRGRKGTAWDVAEKFYKYVDPDFMRKNVRTGLSSGEGVIDAVHDAIMQRVPMREKGQIVGFEDIEASPNIEDKRVLFRQGEFVGVLKALQREGNKLGDVLRNCFDCKDLATQVRHNPLHATSPHIGLAGDITPGELLAECGSQNLTNGFLNRFLFCFSHRSKAEARLPAFDEDAMEKLALEVREAIAAVKGVERFEFSEDAWQVWDEGGLYRALTRGRVGIMDDMTARAEAQVPRLAFSFAMLDGETRVTRKHLAPAAAFWDFSEATMKHVFGDASGDPVADTILSALRAQPGGTMTRTQISSLFGRNLPGNQLDRALRMLLRARLAEKMAKPSRGPELWRALGRDGEARKETMH